MQISRSDSEIFVVDNNSVDGSVEMLKTKFNHVKLIENNVPVQWLDNQWHYFFDTQGFIPKETKFVHTINKKFDVVWRRYYD